MVESLNGLGGQCHDNNSTASINGIWGSVRANLCLRERSSSQARAGEDGSLNWEQVERRIHSIVLSSLCTLIGRFPPTSPGGRGFLRRTRAVPERLAMASIARVRHTWTNLPACASCRAPASVYPAWRDFYVMGNPRRLCLLLIGILLLCGGSAASASDPFQVTPAEISLDGNFA